MFPSYIENPTNYWFEGQDEDERILLLLRAHPITNLPWIISAIFIFFIPHLVTAVAPLLGYDLTIFPETFLLAFLMIDYLLILAVVFEGFLHWYFNATIVSNKQIVDINFESLLYKNVDLAPLDKIEETDSKVGGLLGTFLNFGDVSVQTAGARVAIVMYKIPNPAKVADMLLDLARRRHH